MQKTITTAKYESFQKAYSFFNRELFAASPLPEVMITLQRHSKAYGYFHANQFAHRTDADRTAHETEDEDMVQGWGCTESAAIADLMERLDEHAA